MKYKIRVMKYFTKYLPVEGEIKDGDIYKSKYREDNGKYPYIKFHQNNSTIPEEDNLGKVKLFLCSRDIQIGDRVNVERDGYDYGTVIRFGKDNDCEIVWIKTNEGKEEDWVKSSVYKVIKEEIENL